ncbi:3110_t:CDS:2, partial [Funneliformis mosseae]
DVDVFWQKIERHLAEEEASRSIMHNITKAFKTSIANVNTSVNNVDNTMLQYNKELEGEKSDGLGKRRNLEDREEGLSIKKQHKEGCIMSSASSPPPCSVLIDSPEDGDPSDDYRIREANVSQLFRNFQNKSIWIAKNGGLFVESNVHEILSLSSIFLLTPNSHSKIIIDIFGSRLLDEIHQNVMPVQNTTLNSKYELKFREAIKKVKKSRECAIDWFYTELASDRNLRKSSGSLILKCLETLPSEKIRNEPSEITYITNYIDNIMKSLFHNPDKHIVQWPNKALNESKSRKYEGRTKQPDFVVSIIYQLQTDSVIFVGEVSPPSQRNNVYKNCKDLIQLGVFMKDCVDSAIDKGADINVFGFHCVDHIIDFYIIELIQGTYFIVHIGQVSVPASMKEMPSFVDELELLLGIQEIFQKSFDTLYDKLCSPSSPSNNAIFKRDTLGSDVFSICTNRDTA